ncbi:MAG: ribose-5-phosphate isomerase RpiA [Thermomicrobia bacterium]|nr:ribose-5-phosphate isomerase RpiA [Thermomicrobia bacterium]
MAIPETARVAAQRAAGEHAATFVADGMIVGLGTGSTAFFAIAALAARVARGLRIRAIPTSRASAVQARSGGIPLTTLNTHPAIDLTIDGADEVDPEMNVIKGRGGALLREKIVASATTRQVIIVDETKVVRRLGERMPLPVEIAPFGWKRTSAALAALGLVPTLRRSGTAPFHTDNGNYIVDCTLPGAFALHDLAAAIKATVGVVEHGFFLGLTHTVVIGTPAGIEVRGQQ